MAISCDRPSAPSPDCRSMASDGTAAVALPDYAGDTPKVSCSPSARHHRLAVGGEPQAFPGEPSDRPRARSLVSVNPCSPCGRSRSHAWTKQRARCRAGLASTRGRAARAASEHGVPAARPTEGLRRNRADLYAESCAQWRACWVRLGTVHLGREARAQSEGFRPRALAAPVVISHPGLGQPRPKPCEHTRGACGGSDPADKALGEDDGCSPPRKWPSQTDADWLVLSACNTAAGVRSLRRDALSGLARAFSSGRVRAVYTGPRLGSTVALITKAFYEMKAGRKWDGPKRCAGRWSSMSAAAATPSPGGAPFVVTGGCR